jgi:anaerobic selenocysteine-containing dehydrogenase
MLGRYAGVSEEENSKVVKSMCGMCPTCCGIDVFVKDGKIKEVSGMKEHFLGNLCIKGKKGMIDWQYSDQRLLTPLKNTDGGWEEISWDEAFTLITDKLTDIKQRYGARSLAVHVGFPFIDTNVEKLIRRFCDVYGSPNYTSGSSFCNMARRIGTGLTFNHHGILPIANYSGARCMILWGSNPPHTLSPKVGGAIFSMKNKGSHLIVVNPRTIDLAKKADIHAQIRPGTDCALALGLLNVIVMEELYDREFVQNWTIGFDALAEHIKDYPPEKVEKMTWVPADMIRNIARIYANSKPATIHEGISLDHCTNGIQAIRAVSLLIAITGNFDVHGGDRYTLPLQWSDLRLREKVADELPIDQGKYPLFNKFVHDEVHTLPVLDGILHEEPYPIKALIFEASNPAITWPNANKVKKAFEKLDFMVVIDLFMTETAKYADIVLPATTFLERDDLHMYLGIPVVQLRRQAVEPPESCMDDWRIWAEMGKRMGYEEYFPWNSSDELFESILEPTNVTLRDLKEKSNGLFYSPKSEPKRYLKEGFNTPSGKAELYSDMMAKHGYDPLPSYKEPAESPISRPDIASHYPLILITGPRHAAFTHSQFRNVASLRKYLPEPLVEINPHTAWDLGIADGDKVALQSPRGSIKLKARLTEEIHHQVVSVLHGWGGEANANLLTDDEERDPISGYPGFRSLLCKVAKVSNEKEPDR